MTNSFLWTALLYLLGSLAFGYLLGSIPFGLLLTRLAGAGDIRRIGSGNIGATNVLRTGRKGLALATLLLDGVKGAAALLIAFHAYGEDAALVAGAGALFGHVFPVWLGFKGGKGVATALGLLLAAAWPIGALACLTWLLVAALFRFSSLAALAAIALAPLYAWAFDQLLLPLWGSPIVYAQVAKLAVVIALLVWVRHAGNIQRLLAGTEPRIGAAKN
ncbi:MAG: glycerol-3-phosphate 1-O-acyltransferase PlsY [Rhodospirillaceae bacterium]|nr:glycerol-3-phosphate 1-O-acyltransferase PlsY [Rhodospirillaceae bacterium]